MLVCLLGYRTGHTQLSQDVGVVAEFAVGEVEVHWMGLCEGMGGGEQCRGLMDLT
jgi:hypothetical protein